MVLIDQNVLMQSFPLLRPKFSTSNSSKYQTINSMQASSIQVELTLQCIWYYFTFIYHVYRCSKTRPDPVETGRQGEGQSHSGGFQKTSKQWNQPLVRWNAKGGCSLGGRCDYNRSCLSWKNKNLRIKYMYRCPIFRNNLLITIMLVRPFKNFGKVKQKKNISQPLNFKI